MIDRKSIKELLDKEHFEWFRIYMSDGHAYEVTNSDDVATMDTKIFIVLPGDRWKFLSYAQITRIESGVGTA